MRGDRTLSIKLFSVTSSEKASEWKCEEGRKNVVEARESPRSEAVRIVERSRRKQEIERLRD